MLVFNNNEPCLDITVCETKGPNFMTKFGLHRDRYPDRDWPELRNSRIEGYAKDVPETTELRKVLLEDLAYAYGSDTIKFSEKLKEFNFI